jgi:hypothetical protein
MLFIISSSSLQQRRVTCVAAVVEPAASQLKLNLRTIDSHHSAVQVKKHAHAAIMHARCMMLRCWSAHGQSILTSCC